MKQTKKTERGRDRDYKVFIQWSLQANPFFLYNCMQTRLMDQYKGKWPISLVRVSKPMITEITAIDVRKKIANKIRNKVTNTEL